MRGPRLRQNRAMIGWSVLALMVLALVGGPVAAAVVGRRPGTSRRVAAGAAVVVTALVALWSVSLFRTDPYYGADSGRRIWDNDPSMRPAAVVAMVLGVAVAGLLALAATGRDERATSATRVGLLLMPAVVVALVVAGVMIGSH